MEEALKVSEYTVLSHQKNNLVCEFILGDRFLKKTVCSSNYHFHSAYEVHICVNGKMQVTVEDQIFELHSRDVCIIAPGKVHYITFEEGAYSMGFRFRFSCKGEAPEDEWLFGAFSNFKDAFILRKSEVLERYISNASQNMKSNGSSFVTSSLLFLSLYDLAGAILGNVRSDSVEAGHAVDVVLAEEIETYVNSNYNRKMTLSELASHIHLGNRQTERTIKRLFGMTYGELLNQKRLAAAKLLMRRTNQKLEDIAFACGFDDPSYFSRRFTAMFGMPPGKYRALY